jgi:peptidoglycan/xylan/chitin deacetylase (PgdA/CDA1 family)
MGKNVLSLLIALNIALFAFANDSSWIRINQLGYLPKGIKVAVWCTKSTETINQFYLVDASTNKKLYSNTISTLYGKYGPFLQTARLNFSAFAKTGKYYLQVGKTKSPVFSINENVYKGTADFCLQYMRQQRSGFNPFLKDSCHTHDGYTMYASSIGIKDSTFFDVSGGWHDASDYLQYSSTSANATYHLLMAYRDYPNVFSDRYLSNGLLGRNGKADVLDEAKWGLDWLVKMHPSPTILFNQLGDDRDHRGMRIPKEDTYYGKGFERPVYFIDGKPQQRGKFLNNTKGTSSTAAKFSAAFSLASTMFEKEKDLYQSKSRTAYQFAYQIPGVTQTVSVVSPYIYAEDNWVDDMELANATAFWQNKTARLAKAFSFAKQEPITPWLGKDTASHYQWYPFINIGHYELAKQLKGLQRDSVIQYYQKGIDAVWQKAKQNAFYRGIPFIWCSNNLTVAFAMQCKWYASLSGNHQYDQLEQANIDWLFGCNPWGTSMVYGLPFNGDTPVDPHSAFTHIKNYPINGGLVDGPVYTNIYKNLIGIQLKDADEYAPFQSDLAVYHDDYGDYSTNEPTMDGTASLIYLLAAQEASVKTGIVSTKQAIAKHIIDHGAIIKAGPSSEKSIALVFTGDEYGEGLSFIDSVLKQQKVKAGFFFTGRMYRNPLFQNSIKKLINAGHYMGPHSNDHLLYNDWTKRDSLLVSYQQFSEDLDKNLIAMEETDIDINKWQLFIPPYEWWNDSVATWTQWKEMQLFSFTPGTFTNADYTWPEMGKQYKSNEFLMDKIKELIQQGEKLNGSMVLIHVGTDPRRKEKFYHQLPSIIDLLQKNQFKIKRVDELLQ